MLDFVGFVEKNAVAYSLTTDNNFTFSVANPVARASGKTKFRMLITTISLPLKRYFPPLMVQNMAPFHST